MAIDLRANTTCSLGPLVSGTLADSYVQEQGLVFCRGSVELDGIFSPKLGAKVQFTYTKHGQTYSLPRVVRVLSSFADPFRKRTTVQLGCKLTYLSDLREAEVVSNFVAFSSSGITEEDTRKRPYAIGAQWAAQWCLDKLGVTAASSFKLNNVMLSDAFDFSPGYVQVLGDLLLSESLFGYLDDQEKLQVRPVLEQKSTQGPLWSGADVVDLSPIGEGPMAGEAVSVRYRFKKLRKKDKTDDAEPDDFKNWEKVEVIGAPAPMSVTYTAKYLKGQPQQTWTENNRPYSSTLTTYGVQLVKTEGEDKPRNVEVVRKTEELSRNSANARAGGFLTAKLEWTGTAFSGDADTRTTTEFTYDLQGRVSKQVATTRMSRLELTGSLGIPLSFADGSFVQRPTGTETTEVVTTTYSYGQGLQREEVTTERNWWLTFWGQQTIAELGDSIKTAAQASALLNTTAGLVNEGTVVTMRRTDTKKPAPSRPTPSERWGEELTENDDALAWAVGSAQAERRVEFSMPYQSDEAPVYGGSGSGVISVSPSNAAAMALLYGRAQNRLRLGNRNGVSLQVAAERLPKWPMDSIYLLANGITGEYRVNGTSWAMSGEGIVASVDALLWGAVSADATADLSSSWVPLPPGVTTLPPPPPTISDPTLGVVITPPAVVPPFVEIIRVTALVRTSVVLARGLIQDLSPRQAALVVRTKTTNSFQSMGWMSPAVHIRLRAYQSIDSKASPAIHTKVYVQRDPITIRPVIKVRAYSVVKGVSLSRVAGLRVRTQISAVNLGIPDPYFSKVVGLYHLDEAVGTNFYLDSSSFRSNPSRRNSSFDTTRSKFGAGCMQGTPTGPFIACSPTNGLIGTGDFTVEGWIYLTALPATAGYIHSQFGANQSLMLTPAGNLRYYTNAASATPNAVVLNDWNFYVLTRSAGTMRIYLNGTKGAADVTDTANLSTNGNYFGSDRLGGGTVNGWYDEIRITVGVGRYTGATMTVPTAAFPNS